MLSKAISQISRRHVLCRLQSRPMSAERYAPTVKEAHMNDFPAPHEPFESGYKRRQIGNNFVLIAGVTFFTCTAAFVWNSGVIVPNLTPPKVPLKINYYAKDEPETENKSE